MSTWANRRRPDRARRHQCHDVVFDGARKEECRKALGILRGIGVVEFLQCSVVESRKWKRQIEHSNNRQWHIALGVRSCARSRNGMEFNIYSLRPETASNKTPIYSVVIQLTFTSQPHSVTFQLCTNGHSPDIHRVDLEITIRSSM
jgi:hypothetical protein